MDLNNVEISMKKFVSILIGIILTVIILIGAMILGAGYAKYKQAIGDISLVDKVNEVRSSETYVKIDDISNAFKDAIVAIEDIRFYDHGAVEFKSFAVTAPSPFFSAIAPEYAIDISSFSLPIAVCVFAVFA